MALHGWSRRVAHGQCSLYGERVRGPSQVFEVESLLDQSYMFRCDDNAFPVGERWPRCAVHSPWPLASFLRRRGRRGCIWTIGRYERIRSGLIIRPSYRPGHIASFDQLTEELITSSGDRKSTNFHQTAFATADEPATEKRRQDSSSRVLRTSSGSRLIPLARRRASSVVSQLMPLDLAARSSRA